MVANRRYLYRRIYEVPAQSFFLFGVRGVGKSTWAKEMLPQARRIDLLDETLYQSYLADPEIFAGELRLLPPRTWVMVDEIQRIPGLLNQVHRFIEDAGLRFALLGSSARKLKTPGTNLLAGRALKKNMFPLVPEELGKDFSLEQVLTFGSLPVIHQSASKKDALRAYAELYLKEEIKAEAVVRNLSGFARFLPVAALFHAQTINVAALARDAAVARTTIAGYIEILEDTLMAFRLPPNEARLRVRERKHPKLFWIDPGVVRAVKRQLGPVTSEERGPLLEGWIATLLRTYAETREIFDELFYWAPAESHLTEVDFLLRRGRDFLALEVKSSRKLAPQMFSGLRAISDLPRLTRRILLYSGDRAFKTEDGIEVWPVERLLAALSRDQLWP